MFRTVLVALLTERGYTHDPETDPYDLYWRAPDGTYRPMLVHVAAEMNRDLPGGKAAGWNTYEVSVAVPTAGGQ